MSTETWGGKSSYLHLIHLPPQLQLKKEFLSTNLFTKYYEHNVTSYSTQNIYIRHRLLEVHKRLHGVSPERV